MKNKIQDYTMLLLTCFFLTSWNMFAQVSMSAQYNNDNLKLKFVNNSECKVTLPDLSSRFGPDKKYLYSEYYSIENDTLYLKLKENMDQRLYSIRNAEKIQGKTSAVMKYKDKSIYPGKSYKTRIRLKESKKVIFLVLIYEDLRLETKLN